MPSDILKSFLRAKEVEKIFQKGLAEDVFSYDLNSSWAIITLVGKVHVIGHVLNFYPKSSSSKVRLFPENSRAMRSLTGAQVLRLLAGREDLKSIIYLEKLRTVHTWRV